MPVHRALLRGGSVIVLLALALLGLTGCGDTTTSDTARVIRANNQGDPAKAVVHRAVNGGPFESLIDFGPSDLILQGTITIAIEINDSDTGGEIDLLSEWSTDGGVTWNVATGYLNPVPPAIGDFGTAVDVYVHDPSASTSGVGNNSVDFVWESSRDLASGSQICGLIFRVTPDDRTDGGVPGTLVLGLDQTPSLFAPEITSVSTPVILPGLVVPGSNITLTYAAVDTDSPANLIGIEPAFSTDGATGSLTPATEAPAPPSISEGVSCLAASPSGVSHVYVWDSATDFETAGILCTDNVVFTFTPQDIGTILSAASDGGGATIGDLTGVPGQSGPFTVANFPTSPSRGVVTLPTPMGTQTGCIDIAYSISDDDSSPSGAFIEFSTDGSLTWSLATENTDQGTSEGFCGATGLATSPVGVGHLFNWNTIADGLSGIFPGVLLRITPFDGLLGTPATTGTFTVSNPGVSAGSPPGIVITTPEPTPPATTLESAINIGYLAVDFDGDPADLLVEFSTDGGASWLVATERPTETSEGIQGLSTSLCGDAHIFAWDSLCDEVGLAGQQDALVRMSATDVSGTGAYANTGIIPVVNGVPTVSASNAMAEGTAPLGGGVQVTYDLTSTVLSTCVNIIVEYSLNGGVSFTAATELVGPPSDGIFGLLADTEPTPHTFVWDSEGDGVALGGATESNVVMRIRPLMVGVAGSAAISPPFTVENP